MLYGKISDSLGALNLKTLRMLCHGNIIGAIPIDPKITQRMKVALSESGFDMHIVYLEA